MARLRARETWGVMRGEAERSQAQNDLADAGTTERSSGPASPRRSVGTQGDGLAQLIESPAGRRCQGVVVVVVMVVVVVVVAVLNHRHCPDRKLWTAVVKKGDC